MDDIDRDVYEGIGPDGIDVRLYEDTSRPEIPKLPSVTTILETRDDGKSNLYDWQDRNDGTGNNAYHKHLFWYSRHVGTLGHWHALNELDSSLEWTEDEEESKKELRRQLSDDLVYEEGHPKVGKRASPREVLYSVLRGDRDKAGGIVSSWGEFYDRYPPYKNGDYYRNALVERAEADVEFFKDAILRLWNKLGISPLNTISVEQFLFNDEYGYAGQVDLVYEDADGYTVVADLKSSSGCYDKHQIQGAAYAKSVEVFHDEENDDPLNDIEEVDRLEVHRAHPRTGQMAAHTHRDAPGKQAIHTTKYWNDDIDTLWNDFHSLISNFDGYDWSEE